MIHEYILDLLLAQPRLALKTRPCISCESIIYLIFELAKTLLNVALGCLNFD